MFWLRNPAAFHDDFWCLFIDIWVQGFGFISQLSWHLIIPRQPLGYYICSGIDPTELLKTPLKIYGLVEISSILLNVFICIRIKIYKSKEKSLNVGLMSCQKSLFLADVELMSLANFGIILTNLTIYSLIILNQVVKSISASKLINYLIKHEDAG